MFTYGLVLSSPDYKSSKILSLLKVLVVAPFKNIFLTCRALLFNRKFVALLWNDLFIASFSYVTEVDLLILR